MQNRCLASSFSLFNLKCLDKSKTEEVLIKFSCLFRDPNGYVVELAAKKETYADESKDYNQSARAALAEWSDRKFSKD